MSHKQHTPNPVNISSLTKEQKDLLEIVKSIKDFDYIPREDALKHNLNSMKEYHKLFPRTPYPSIHGRTKKPTLNKLNEDDANLLNKFTEKDIIKLLDMVDNPNELFEILEIKTCTVILIFLSYHYQCLNVYSICKINTIS